MKRLSIVILFVVVAQLPSAVARDKGGDYVVFDVRTQKEFSRGHVAHAINVPHTKLKSLIASIVPDKSRQIYLYCASGGRSGMAAKDLQALGYKNVKNIMGFKDARKFLKTLEVALAKIALRRE